MKIKKLATVQMGYSFRSRLEVSEDGEVAVIQMKDLLDDNTVSCDDLVRINMEAMKEHHLAQRGDLVFRSRGHVTEAESNGSTWALCLSATNHLVVKNISTARKIGEELWVDALLNEAQDKSGHE